MSVVLVAVFTPTDAEEVEGELVAVGFPTRAAAKEWLAAEGRDLWYLDPEILEVRAP